MADSSRRGKMPPGSDDDDGEEEEEEEEGEQEEEEEEEEDEERRGRPMLSILFGNVDDSGDLDEEYLDQDAKEHLSALANQLGQSLVDIELSARRKDSGAWRDGGEDQEDYGRKAEDAVDYEDIDEQYEGPEVQLSQDEHAISQNQQFYAQAALAGPSSTLGALTTEEEDYDEDKDDDKECDEEEVPEKKEDHAKEHLQVTATEGLVKGSVTLPSAIELSFESDLEQETKLEEFATELEADTSVEDLGLNEALPKLELPVLYEEDGKEVLRFSELFGHQEPVWGSKREKKHQKHFQPREMRQIANELLEEDEDALLKSCSMGREAFDGMRPPPEEVVDVGSFMDDEDAKLSDSSEDDVRSTFQNKSTRRGWKNGQPMKEDTDRWESALETIKVIPSPNLHPLHQENWEASIVWDEGHSLQVRADPTGQAYDNSGVMEDMDIDTREENAFCMMERDEPWQYPLERSISEDIPNHDPFHVSRPVNVEPLCHKPCLQSAESLRTLRHPQLLRLESLPGLKEANSNLRKELDNDSVVEIATRFCKMNLQNIELFSGGWLDQIVWDNDNVTAAKQPIPKVIFNLQDDQMVFEIPEGQDLRRHAAAMILTPNLRSTMAEGGENHGASISSLARFNISNDKYYMNKKNPQQQKSSLKKRAVHGIKVMHSLPALKLQTMKPKLTNKDLANFHRPKAVWYPHHNEVAAKEQGKLSVEGPMKVILKAMGGKGSKLYVDASEALQSVKLKATKKFGDLKASEKTKIYYCGKELEDGITLAQQEVKPNSVLHLVRTKVHPWPKAQKLPGENKATRPPGAFKRKSDLSVKDGHVFLAEYCEERPLLLNNVGMGARLCTYYRKMNATDSTAATLRTDQGSSVGIPLPLEPLEDSPFLGNIRPGEMQTCIETNLYRAPAFHHKVPHTDFLLVRSAKGKLSLRRIDSIHVIGQQEPHTEVLTPGAKTVQSFLNNRLLVYIYREFRNNEKPGSVTRLRADEVAAQFPSLSEGYLRKRLKHCADLQKGSGGEMWWVMKQNFRIPSEEELRRMVTPENVCTYESMQAGLYHLKKMGVSKLTQPSGLSAAMNQLPGEAIVLAAASHIERELQITPWNLSCNFVAAAMQGRSFERLEITGAGDPSGRGLGFSYLRVAPKPPGAGALVEKKAAAARGGGAVTGTDADLRRLSMDAAREVLLKFNVPESQIEKLTRWHRIALVRKLSSEQAATGAKLGVTALNKFARGHRMSLLQVQQQIREKCQTVWDRQVQSLSAVDEERSESEGEANEDLDSFAGDLENLLEAEEGETEEVASTKTKKETIRGTSARRRALEAQREEDIEDEEAEAAELRRMLMEDDEVENGKKKKKMVNNGKEKKDQEDIVKEQKKDVPDAVKGNGIRKKKIIKRIIRKKKADGTYTSEEIVITDPVEVERYLAQKKAAQNGSSVNEKKVSLAVKKAKKLALTKDGTKPKKPGKGESGREGVHLVCGACKQVGHMRTNKKVCPLYSEEARANALAAAQANTQSNAQPSAQAISQKAETIEVADAPVRQGIKITLKSTSGPQDKEVPVSVSTPVEKKFPSLKIKLPLISNVESAPGSSSKVEGNSTLPTGATPKQQEEGTRLIKKIKIKKAPKLQKEDQLEDNDDKKARESRLSDHGQPSAEVGLSWQENVNSARLHEVEPMSVMELTQANQKKDVISDRQTYVSLLERENLKNQEKKKIKESKEKRRQVNEKEAKLRRKEELKIRLRFDKEKEVEKQSEAEKVLEMERRKEMELIKEQEWMEKQREREKQEREMEKIERLRMEREKLEMQQREFERMERQMKQQRERKKLERQQRERERENMQQREREMYERHRERERMMEAREHEERERKNHVIEKYTLQERRSVKMSLTRDRKSLEQERLTVTKRKLPVDVNVCRGVSDYVQQPKRRKGGEVQLANILESIVDTLRKRTEISYLFLKPVTKKEAPDYLDVIQHPMDLSLIRERTRKLVYKSQADFRRDVFQITENAHIYNEHRNPQIPPIADSLLQLCDELLEERYDEIMEAESAIERIEDNPYPVPPRTSNRRLSRPH